MTVTDFMLDPPAEVVTDEMIEDAYDTLDLDCGHDPAEAIEDGFQVQTEGIDLRFLCDCGQVTVHPT